MAYFADMMTDALTREVAGRLEGGGPEFRTAMQRMGKDGLLGISWPKEYGGQERSAIEQFIFADEIQAIGFPFPFLTLNTIGPVLRKHGTQEQKRYFLPKILAGEIFFSVGYSEPSAGTDLAALKTKAVRDGDEWVINGQKMWTSLAEYADYIWLAARTDPDAEKHSGLSMFLVPTTAKGFSRQPIRTVGGVSTNATFYDDVRVPAENLIGGENNGWRLIVGQLNHERISLMTVGLLRRNLEAVTEWARQTTDRRPAGHRQAVGPAESGAPLREGAGPPPDELAASLGGDEGSAEHGGLLVHQGLRQRAEPRSLSRHAGGDGRRRHSSARAARVPCCTAKSSRPIATD